MPACLPLTLQARRKLTELQEAKKNSEAGDLDTLILCFEGAILWQEKFVRESLIPDLQRTWRLLNDEDYKPPRKALLIYTDRVSVEHLDGQRNAEYAICMSLAAPEAHWSPTNPTYGALVPCRTATQKLSQFWGTGKAPLSTTPS